MEQAREGWSVQGEGRVGWGAGRVGAGRVGAGWAGRAGAAMAGGNVWLIHRNVNFKE